MMKALVCALALNFLAACAIIDTTVGVVGSVVTTTADVAGSVVSGTVDTVAGPSRQN